MRRARGTMVLAVVCAQAVMWVSSARADEFLAGLSKLATREACKQLRDKRLKFTAGAIDGHVQAVEPERYLTAEVVDFELEDDLLDARVVAKGRFRLDGKVDGKTEFSAVADVTANVLADVRFTKEGSQYFVEARIHDLDVGVTILEVLPADLAGGEELLSSLAMAAFKKNKQQIIADANKRIGKRPF
jgi:hypothetical protein